MSLFLIRTNFFFYYEKNILASLYISKYFYKNVYKIFRICDFVVKTKYYLKRVDIRYFLSLLKLLFLLLYRFTRNQPRIFFFVKVLDNVVLRRSFTMYCLLKGFRLYRYLSQFRFFGLNLRGFFDFNPKICHNQLIFKFSELDVFIDYILYYIFRNFYKAFSVKHSEFLAFLVRHCFFFTYFLNFSEVSFSEKFVFFSVMFELPLDFDYLEA